MLTNPAYLIAVETIGNRRLSEFAQLITQRQLNAVRDERGMTLLHHIAAYDFHEAVPIALSSGIALCTRDALHRTALDVAVRSDSQRTLAVLIEANGLACGADHEGCTAIHCCAAYGSIECMRMVRNAWREIDVVDAKGWNALHFAAYHGNDANVLYLVNEGLSVLKPDHEGLRPIHLAAMQGHVELVQTLIDLGTPIDIRDSLGKTSLILAITCAREEAATTLLSLGADVEARDVHGARAADYVTNLITRELRDQLGPVNRPAVEKG